MPVNGLGTSATTWMGEQLSFPDWTGQSLGTDTVIPFEETAFQAETLGTVVGGSECADTVRGTATQAVQATRQAPTRAGMRRNRQGVESALRRVMSHRDCRLRFPTQPHSPPNTCRP